MTALYAAVFACLWDTLDGVFGVDSGSLLHLQNPHASSKIVLSQMNPANTLPPLGTSKLRKTCCAEYFIEQFFFLQFCVFY
jgi:hypothetical protein